MNQHQHQQPNQEEVGNIETILRLNPLVLENTVEINKVADLLLPYSTGIEIECDKQDNYQDEFFESIPDIMDVDTDSSEQRYRIPNGLKGFKCLFNIYENLKVYSIPNSDAGHHFHIDFTDSYQYINEESMKHVEEYILTELDTWNYQGTYNSRSLNWFRFQNGFKTLEIRICDMSFDYSYIVNKILHCQEIAKQVKIDIRKYALKKVKPIELQEKEKKELKGINPEEIIKQRKVILWK